MFAIQWFLFKSPIFTHQDPISLIKERGQLAGHISRPRADVQQSAPAWITQLEELLRAEDKHFLAEMERKRLLKPPKIGGSVGFYMKSQIH